MKPLKHQINRRHMLKGSTALGVSSVLSSTLLSACGGSNGSDTPKPPPASATREARTLHFDLSHSPIANPRISLVSSSSHNVALVAHTDQSRALHRANDPVLRAVPDANLTHYLESVDLPATALQLGSVWGKDPKTGGTMLATHFLHVPISSLQALEKRRASRGQSARAMSAKLKSYGVSQAALDAAPITSSIGPNSAPFDIVTTLLFQHPAITNLNADLGADIIDRIQNLPCADGDYSCTPYSGTVMEIVANMISTGGFVTTTSAQSWAMLTTFVDPDTGVAAVDPDTGSLVYNMTINSALSDPIAQAIKQIINSINDDPLFMNTNWQDPAGSASAGAISAVVKAQSARARAAAVGDGQFSVVCDAPFNTRRSGVRLLDISTSDQRAVNMTVVNEFLKSYSVFVQYYDANGQSIANTNPSSYDDGDAIYNSIISPDNQIMGIPMLGNAAMTSTIRFNMPPGAASATLTYGSVGLGGSDAFSKKALMGSIFTLCLNLALPTICLISGVNQTFNGGLQSAFKKAMEDPIVQKRLLAMVLIALSSGSLNNGVQSSISNLSIQPFLVGMGTTVAQFLLQMSPNLTALILGAVTSSAATKIIPVVGQAIWALSALADAATITETLVECICCPAIQTIDLALAMPSSVVVSRDPRDYQFPATASKIVATATYSAVAPGAAGLSKTQSVVSKGSSRTVTATASVTTGRVDPVTISLQTLGSDGSTLQGVLSGGYVQVTVSLYNDQGCLVGVGTSAWINNMPGSATSIPVTITEMLVPLNSNTKYGYQSTLTFAGNTHAWDSTVPAPTMLQSQLCQGNDGAICSLNGITVNTASGMAGYGFFAGSQSMVQNIFLGDGPDRGFFRSKAGSSQPIGVAYSPSGSQSFFLQLDSNGTYSLRSVDFSNATFDASQPLIWGRFLNPHQSMCIVGGGYVVGMNRSLSKLEVLKLPATPSAQSSPQVGTALDFSAMISGSGTRVGLINRPVAVAAYGDLIYVLEQGNTRVQAFDIDGGVPTVRPFKDSSGSLTSVFPLHYPGASTFLDIAVESAGYVYVLSYESSGTNAYQYKLDLYAPDGTWLSQTPYVAAGNLAVDVFRNVYTLNYAPVAGSPNVEPSISKWLPQAPAGTCGATTLPSAARTKLASACIGVPTGDA